jgi:EamA domain-containing membrane protein RarD
MRPLAVTVLYVGAAAVVVVGLVLAVGFALYGLVDLAVSISSLWSKP